MKFSVFNAMTTITIIALTIALIVNYRRDRRIFIEGYDFFESAELLNSRTKRSTWTDRTAPPPVSTSEVVAIAERTIKKLNSNREKIKSTWSLDSVCLVPLGYDEMDSAERDQWIYEVVLRGIEYPGQFRMNHAYTLRFLVLMDETVLFHEGENSRDVIKLIEELGIEVTGRPSNVEDSETVAFP